MFTVADAIRNLHRLDSSLLESFMTRHGGGLQLLAGANTPVAVEPSTAEFARLFDMLVGHFRYVVVDASIAGRCDHAAGVQPFGNRAAGGPCRCGVVVECGPDPAISGRDRRAGASAAGAEPFPQDCRLQRSRCGSCGGSQAAVEDSQSVLRGIGAPSIAAFRSCSRAIREIARSFAGLAAGLTENDVDVKREAWSLFKTV